MVPFAGWSMPVQYRGILAEHRHTRARASLFDVSHMGQVRIAGDEPAAALETLVPGSLLELKPGRIRYTVLTTEAGGIIDDLMVTNTGEDLYLVLNAGRREVDLGHMRERLPAGVMVEELAHLALIALQGPEAESVLARLAPACRGMRFMDSRVLEPGGVPCRVSRSGYTGEDGFEISVPGEAAADLWRRLAGEPEVEPAGLGARDSLRLEAGLCLWGHDIDTTTTPVEADIGFAIGKRRREQGGFPGDSILREQLRDGPERLRVGIRPEGRAPAREHTEIHDEGGRVGLVTSGGFGPTIEAPVAMGYVERRLAEPGTALSLVVRGTPRPARVAPLPFVPHRYKR
jgi:aminomethyltransferase